MPKMGSSSSSFEVGPAGTHVAARLVDICDLGVREGQYGPRQLYRWVFAFEAKDSAGERKVFLASKLVGHKPGVEDFHPKSAMYAAFEALGFKEGDDVSEEAAIGRVATIKTVRVTDGNGGVFLNVDDLMPAPEGTVATFDVDFYVRKRDREDEVPV